MTKLFEFKKEIEQEFEKYNIDKTEVNILFCEALNLSRAELFAKSEISAKEKKMIERYAKKRIAGMPVQKIFKRAYFFDNVFYVNQNVLCPRPETELLVEECLKFAQNGNTILDLCTGSGCIAITIKNMFEKSNKNCTVVASDVSSKALAVAKKNARQIGVDVQFVKSDMFKKFEQNIQKTSKNQQKNANFEQKSTKIQKNITNKIIQKFDIIISNPPYIKSADINFLDIEVKNFDPVVSLDGGSDGLDFYRIIANQSAKYLNPHGKVFLEVGEGEAQDVANLLKEKGFDCFVKKDYNNIERIVVGELL